jgi:DNA-binding transcriptional ArsR family regulator
MAFPHHQSFPKANQSLAHICEALSHPARQIILSRLVQSKGWISREELTENIPLHDSTISQHLRKLRRIGLLTSQNVGFKTEHKLAQVGESVQLFIREVLQVATKHQSSLSDEINLDHLQRRAS